MLQIAENRFQPLVPKEGVCFEVDYDTKLVPRISISPRPMYPKAACHLGNWVNKEPIKTMILYNNFFCS